MIAERGDPGGPLHGLGEQFSRILEFFPEFAALFWSNLDWNGNGMRARQISRRPVPVTTAPLQIPCPNCGTEIKVRLGIAAPLVWQAVRLQSARPGAIVFCPNCNSYFVFGPCALTEQRPLTPPGETRDEATLNDQDADNGGSGQ
ncbi:MAG TPA: hypothetical protein VML55_04190 [Planctomycetaceae bacterium]|nr:hypothetical protein [Planctomycetaceae bacterium]